MTRKNILSAFEVHSCNIEFWNFFNVQFLQKNLEVTISLSIHSTKNDYENRFPTNNLEFTVKVNIYDLYVEEITLSF